MQTRKCLNCGRNFIVAREGQFYCSSYCYEQKCNDDDFARHIGQIVVGDEYLERPEFQTENEFTLNLDAQEMYEL
jgi:hypothetical protein